MALAAARSRAYTLLAAATAYPDEALWETLADGRFAAALAESMAEATGEPAVVAAPAGSLAELQAEYVAAFDLGRGGPGRSLHEGDHRPAETRPDLLVELAAFYRCFGLGTQHCTAGLDHLSVALEFMHFLAFHEAGGAAGSAPYRHAQRDFVARHLADWVPAVAAAHGESGFHGSVLAAAARLVAADAGRYETEPAAPGGVGAAG
ncbi:molecular chaperone TorD family protein [Magnetospirillum sp. UT-4]|uniref:molecular chaperone TorD family protein n=1 Tax=Magnetospirillum sp. UT-4 TaxID=2681467 RepID=UPI00138176C8|nr:molecular chaperone TorD family protein [Magnetospirillum sp. UT-4]CAA7620497.1 putative Perchlorate reductase assembly chaperone protein [Magnetospirillum sp. UT-4]